MAQICSPRGEHTQPIKSTFVFIGSAMKHETQLQPYEWNMKSENSNAMPCAHSRFWCVWFFWVLKSQFHQKLNANRKRSSSLFNCYSLALYAITSINNNCVLALL